jgi:hypothetical protein
MYDDTISFLEKGEYVLKWGDVYSMFKKQNFTFDAEDKDEIKIFKNIRKYGIHRVAAHFVVFPCINVVSWISNM